MKNVFLFIIFSLLMSGCAAPTAISQPVEASPLPAATFPATPTLIPAPVSSTLTATPNQPPAPTPSPTPQTIFQGPGDVVCPILLYHRVTVPQTGSEYFVTPEEFRAQMEALKQWGYTSILPSDLVKAILQGTKLPARPVIISFDDGDITVYTTAYPIMRELGFVGVNYLASNFINTPGYMTTAHLQELAAAGWETGSHSVNHKDLTQTSDVEFQVAHSRIALEKTLGLPVETFAYPFGQKNDGVLRMVSRHYNAAMGLGSTTTQRRQNLYYLWRRPVKLGWDVDTFGSFLPWNTPETNPQP